MDLDRHYPPGPSGLQHHGGTQAKRLNKGFMTNSPDGCSYIIRKKIVSVTADVAERTFLFSPAIARSFPGVLSTSYFLSQKNAADRHLKEDGHQ
jgi:hypothetical protein